ncbi:virion structural protein [Erwinia phage vB_EamM_ChrisDB]|uniref:virion structural protein n=1 Tax=Erwinia phage vB_EamM_ChrisDB TaxID=1883371 RepID=UPI00081CA0AA|nr:virion structural protein [Erwinia phage vB_EamM_ChrisDB]ANZ48723.1 putative virion structural protein [Erwinia phage vB_EamM_ChrisDB]
MLNYAKPSSELVFDLINRDNPTLPVKLTPSNCFIEKITNVPVNAASNQRNTQARLRGVQGSGVRDSITVYYDRVSLARLLPWGTGVPSQFVTYDAANTHAALAVLLETYGVNFSQIDIVNANMPGANSPNYTNTVGITALGTSPAYVSAATLRYSRGLPVLDTSIKQDTLPELQHPVDPTLNKKCVDLLTYGIDFTAYKNLLVVDASGLPQWAGLRKVLDDLGVPAYSGPLNSNTVQDVPTATAGMANKAYDRVVIQTGIDETGAKGRAYYHYNS